MSADNGIYILQTNKGDGFEFRVVHLQAVENYQWDNVDKCYTDDEDVLIENAREMWRDCEVFTDKREAFLEADEQTEEILSDDCGILEYGICTIKIDREF